ncbi:MAG: biotin--[acetyl-CoA-carboxylase] ligase [Candidatus Zixiibacteriota bacterium]|nr:MAG: biotin--[acetyl-CoA-carboxylase] ligase [candidate division Zixibacteria bacterium]
MIIYTDDTDCAERFLVDKDIPREKSSVNEDSPVSPLIKRIFKTGNLYTFSEAQDQTWSHLLIAKSAPESQYDILVDMARKNIPLPSGIICLAGEGRKFHGFRGRYWDSPEGNIYLSAHFAPNLPIRNYGAGFMILAAVSVVDAIDEVPGLSGRAGVKWVNDILIDDAKVCGVLAHTIAENHVVTNAIIGIGLNVETRPRTEPTVFVPRAASLAEFVSGQDFYTRRLLFSLLKKTIHQNYQTLINGGFRNLLDRYCRRSNIIGRDVIIYDDTENDIPAKTGEGRVISIGENLELFIEGLEKPVKRGRLAFK